MVQRTKLINDSEVILQNTISSNTMLANYMHNYCFLELF